MHNRLKLKFNSEHLIHSVLYQTAAQYYVIRKLRKNHTNEKIFIQNADNNDCKHLSRCLQ